MVTAQWQPYRTAGVVAADGTLTLQFAPRFAGITRATQVTNWMGRQSVGGVFVSGAGAICELRLNGAFVTAMVPTGSAAGGDPPVDIAPGDVLTEQWTGAPAGARGEMVVIYEVLQ